MVLHRLQDVQYRDREGDGDTHTACKMCSIVTGKVMVLHTRLQDVQYRDREGDCVTHTACKMCSIVTGTVMVLHTAPVRNK